MDRGYIKIWRIAEDSRAWSRGAVHRGVMLTILLKVAWKDCYYRGEDLKAGQFAFSGEYLASECMLSRTTLLAILDDLEADGFLTRRNVGNRYTLITITNWARYQSPQSSGCKAGCSPAEQPTEQLALQQPDTIKEYKKARKELSTASPDAAVREEAFPVAADEAPPESQPDTQGGEEAVPESNDGVPLQAVEVEARHRPSRSGIEDGQAFYVSAKGRRLSGQVLADFEAFWDAYGYRKGKAEAADVWLAATRKAPELVPAIIRAARAAAVEHEELAARVKGRIRMYAENWLQGRRWEDWESGGCSPAPSVQTANLNPERTQADATGSPPARNEGNSGEVLPAAPERPACPLPSPGTPERERLHAMPPTRRDRLRVEEGSERDRRAGAAVLATFWRERGGTIPKFLADMVEKMSDLGGAACLV